MAGRTTPQDPNYKLYAQYGGQAKYLAAKKALDAVKKKYSGQEKKYLAANKVLLADLNDPVDGYYEKLRVAKLQNNTADIAFWKAKIKTTTDKIADNNRKLYIIEDALVKAQKAFEKARVTTGSGSGGSGSGSGTVVSATPGKGPWNFNAPLVKRSDFVYTDNTVTSVNEGTASRRDVTVTQTHVTNRIVKLPSLIPAGTSSVDDAYNFWTKQNYGKGTFQMDRVTNTVELAAEAKKTAEKNKLKFDPKMYGFRFNYNPTTVNMSWAGMTGANPVYEAAGLDPAVPMSSNLFTGTVSFDIILNRIQDLALLNSSGGYIYGENPYPWEISTADRKMIVNKGTMYDLEYLFKTMHGYAFYTNFKSTLMGQTNDPGWLPVRPVELHLGNKLRYRVRVAGLEVVHKIFSEKMVPLLSVVSITCMRYWDGPPAKDPKK